MDTQFSPKAFEEELTGNILPFWMNRAIDPENGGFFGSIDNRLRVDNSAERTAVLYGRILWTFSRAYRMYENPEYLQMAGYTLEYIRRHLLDPLHGGGYWSVDHHGHPVNPRKLTYAQAFLIYGFSEHYLATADESSLAQAQELYRLVEEHTHDPVSGANFEGFARDWSADPDIRLSPRDLNCAKSMNTLLHLIEAYTSLVKAWPDAGLKGVQKDLVRMFLDHVVDPTTSHLKLFFTRDWGSLSETVSYGHDIEAAWLLVEAAEALGDAGLIAETRSTALRIAQTVYAQGRHPDGSLVYERAAGETNPQRHWWVQAEGVVGFYNAYQISGEEALHRASQEAWDSIQTFMVDRVNGEWFKVIGGDGLPVQATPKVGPWECPYHHARMCLEMINRI